MWQWHHSSWWKRNVDSPIKGSQLGAFCPLAIVLCYLEFKPCYLENLKLFSIRVKELFEPIVLRKKGDWLLLFLKAFSWETARWFYGKEGKIGKGNLYLTEKWLSWKEMFCAVDNRNYMCHIMCNRIFDSNFN